MRIFNIDITRKGISPVVQVTEHDAMSRFFTLILRNGNADYEPPENPSYSVWYKTKDSTGWYDTIEEPDNGTHPAVVASGNMFTIEIAEAATTSCGELALMITGDDGYQLTVTGIITQSADIPGYDSSEVENYYNVYITRMQENAARAENAAATAIEYGATVEVDETAQQLIITHTDNTEDVQTWVTEAEAWAVGQRDGVDVPSTDETYHNNAKYYAQAAAQSAASLTVDTELSSTSTNPVQNKVIDATVTELKNETTELKSAITDIIDRTGITQEINFTTVPNVAHVSSDDRIYLKVKQGETVRVRSVTSDNSDIAIMAWFTADDYIAYRTNGNEYRYTAPVDSDYVGIYIGPQSTAYNVTTYVTLDGVLDELSGKVETNSTSIEVLNGYVPIESGSYSDTDGKTKTENNTRYRCKSPVEIASISEIVIPSGYQAWVFMLNENLGLITNTQWVTGSLNPQTFSSYGNVKYITFDIKKTSAPNTDISAEINTVKYAFTTTTVDEKNISDTSAALLAMASSAETPLDIYTTADGWRLNPSLDTVTQVPTINL